jgi:glyoxylase-like metal-dependent hydrolase (beta-lactamase superfamily II)
MSDESDGTGDYTGEVEVGGPPDIRHLPSLTIAKLAVGDFNNNAYLLRCRATGEGLLIDAAAEPDRLVDFVRLDGPAVASVLTTHRHGDHWQGLAAVVEDTRATTLAGIDDAAEIPVETDQSVRHGDQLTVGAVALEIIALRGHTPGSVAVLYRDPGGVAHLFTGDSLFPGGVGKTWSPEDFTSLIDDVEARIFDQLPDDTWFYPGHGFDSTLGAERPHLAEWRSRGW